MAITVGVLFDSPCVYVNVRCGSMAEATEAEGAITLQATVLQGDEDEDDSLGVRNTYIFLSRIFLILYVIEHTI